jgi:hypothetical protein
VHPKHEAQVIILDTKSLYNMWLLLKGRQLAPYITLHHFSGQLVVSIGAELEHIWGGPLRSAIQCPLSSLIEEETPTRYLSVFLLFIHCFFLVLYVMILLSTKENSIFLAAIYMWVRNR